MDQNKKSYLVLVKKQKNEKNWDAMLVSVQQALKEFPDCKKLWRLLHYAQSHYVDAKLDLPLVHDLEDKEDYDALLQVFSRLLMVFPESKKLHKRIQVLHEKKDKRFEKEQNQLILDAQANIRNLMEADKLEESLTACYEVLSLIPTNKACQSMLNKILAKREKSIENELGALSAASYKIVQMEYQADKKSVLKL